MCSNREPLVEGKNFCSTVKRGEIVFRKRTRVSIFKVPRSVWELELLRREVRFYREILPLFNLLNGLVYSGGKLFPRLFRAQVPKRLFRNARLVIEDLKSHYTKANLTEREIRIVLDKLSLFHALGFLLKEFLPTLVSSFVGDSVATDRDKKWFTLVHGDCWYNNFMFAKYGFKFIDFGFTHYNHCLRDLAYFFYTSLSRTQAANVKFYSHYYFQSLRDKLKKTSLNIEEEEFRTEVRKQVYLVLPLALQVIGNVKKGLQRDEQADVAVGISRGFEYGLQERLQAVRSSDDPVSERQQL